MAILGKQVEEALVSILTYDGISNILSTLIRIASLTTLLASKSRYQGCEGVVTFRSLRSTVISSAVTGRLYR